MDQQELFALIGAAYGPVKVRDDFDRPAVAVYPGELLAIAKTLHDHPKLLFDVLVTHTAIDYPDENGIELVYILYSTTFGHWLVVTANLERERPVAPTVSKIWECAEWQEREAYDMFGILYDDHPDLRRIFLEDDWVGFPLRKDYVDEYMLDLPK